MKVYVMTKYRPLGVEEFVDVKKTQKEALKAFRVLFPHMRGSLEDNNLSSDAENKYLLSVKEIELN